MTNAVRLLAAVLLSVGAVFVVVGSLPYARKVDAAPPQTQEPMSAAADSQHSAQPAVDQPSQPLAFLATNSHSSSLHVCVVGSAEITRRWEAMLPRATTFTTFAPPLRRRLKANLDTPRMAFVHGVGPSVVRDYFYRYPRARCNVSIVHEGSGLTKILAMLRSVSASPHVALIANRNRHWNVLKNLTRMQHFVASPPGNAATTPNELYNGYVVKRFSKVPPLPSLGLDAVVAGSWVDVSLEQLNALSTAIIDDIRPKSVEIASGVVEGHSAQLIAERKVYTAVARLPEVRTICEIGFNMGHSASLWLLANPTARVYMFDMWSHDYTPLAAEFLRSDAASQTFGLVNVSGRLTITKGSSLDTVVEFAKTHPDVLCDILSVDGGHTYDIALQDIVNMRKLANPKFHVLFVDDTNCDQSYCVDEPCFEHERRGTIFNVLRIAERFGARGVSAFQYHNPRT